jgi:hypothetical protein
MGLVRYIPASNYDEDLAEFQGRLKEHLALCRSRLLGNALAVIYRSPHNKVSFIVHNRSEEPLDGVQLTAQFDATGMVVMDHEPSHKQMPAAPKWPDIADRYLTGRDFATEMMAGAFAPPFASTPVKVQRDGSVVEIHYQLGDIGPTLKRPTRAITMVPVPNVDSPAVVDIHLVAHAKNRSGIASADVVVTVGADVFALGAAVDPDY